MSSLLPKTGPLIITVPGITNVSIAGGAANPAALNTFVRWLWPGMPGVPPEFRSAYHVAGMLMIPRSGDLVELSNLSIEMLDESSSELFVDGEGLTVAAGAGSMFAGPALLSGQRVFRWYPLNRIVQPGKSKWSIRITNGNVGAVVPWLGFKIEIPTSGRRAA